MVTTQILQSLESRVLNELSKAGITLKFPNPKALVVVEPEDITVEERSPRTSFAIKPTKEAGRVAVEYIPSLAETGRTIPRIFITEKRVLINYKSSEEGIKLYGIWYLPNDRFDV